jgi:hypothetical protein
MCSFSPILSECFPLGLNIAPNEAERDSALFAHAENLLSFVKDLSIKNPHHIIPMQQCANIDMDLFGLYYDKHGLDYLKFCEIHLDLAKYRISLAVEASKQRIVEDLLVQYAIALGGQIGGSLEMCSLVAIQALAKNLYPIVLSLGQDLKPSADHANYDVVIISDHPIDSKEFQALCKRMGKNFYCVIKQLDHAVLIDPILDFIIPSKQLESHRVYKKHIASIHSTKIYSFKIVSTAFDEIQVQAEKLLKYCKKLKDEGFLIFQPAAKILRDKWCHHVQNKLKEVFAPLDIQWTASRGTLGLHCYANELQYDLLKAKLNEIGIAFKTFDSQEDKRKQITFDCFEILQWRELYEKLDAHLVRLRQASGAIYFA